MVRFFVVLLLLYGSSLSAQPVLQMARVEKYAEQAVAEIVLKEIYKRADLSLSVTPLPPARANIEVLAGHYDGEVARIYSYGINNPALLRVEPAYYFLETVVYARKSSKIAIKNKEDLKHYRVGIIRGVLHAKAATEGLEQVQLVATAEQLFRMLDAGRVDVVVDARINAESVLKTLKLADIEMVKVLSRHELFNYLTDKNINIKPRISDIIKKLSATGELIALINAAEKVVLNGGS